ncbi:25-hydroxycholesterol 7-alpha-hydroxylase [Fusarium oxysporum f. sp. albedinis]|nr:25-hydroxycholesterol 7-alpha-hydroxylase [Fusarium oxysporum f. sp. albedinis]
MMISEIPWSALKTKKEAAAVRELEGVTETWSPRYIYSSPKIVIVDSERGVGDASNEPNLNNSLSGEYALHEVMANLKRISSSSKSAVDLGKLATSDQHWATLSMMLPSILGHRGLGMDKIAAGRGQTSQSLRSWHPLELVFQSIYQRATSILVNSDRQD